MSGKRRAKFTPVPFQGHGKTFDGKDPKHKAHRLGPWQMLCVMARYQAGESSVKIGQEFGVCHQSVVRWHRAFGEDVKHMHKAAAQAVVAHELVEAHEALQDLKRKLDRGFAILDGILKRHNVRADYEALYPGATLAPKSLDTDPSEK